MSCSSRRNITAATRSTPSSAGGDSATGSATATNPAPAAPVPDWDGPLEPADDYRVFWPALDTWGSAGAAGSVTIPPPEPP